MLAVILHIIVAIGNMDIGGEGGHMDIMDTGVGEEVMQPLQSLKIHIERLKKLVLSQELAQQHLLQNNLIQLQ